MKKTFIITLVLLSVPLMAFAHPGSLDGNGGHYNRKTGEYHYHSGEHKYGTSSSATRTYYPFTPQPTTEPTQVLAVISATPEPKTQDTLAEKTFMLAIIFLILGAPAIIFLVACRAWIAKGKNLIIDWMKRTIQFIKSTKNAKKTKNSSPPPQNKSPLIPEGYAIGKDGLPYKTNRQYGWGREFNVFITSNGEHFHRGRCKIIKGKEKKLMHRYFALKRYEPCAYCKPKYNIDNWYIEYKGADKGKEQLSLK